MRAVNLLPAQRSSTSVSLSSLKSIRPGHVVAVVLLALAVMAVIYGNARKQAQTYEAEAATVNAQVATVKRSVAAFESAAAAIPAAEKSVGAAAKIANTRFAWAPLFHHLATRVPAGVEFTGFTVTLVAAGGAAGASASARPAEPGTPAGASVVLTGCAEGQRPVASLLRSLRGIPGVSEVNLQSSTEPVHGATSGTGSSSGSCPAQGPVFNLTVELLPATQAAAGAVTRAVLARGTK